MAVGADWTSNENLLGYPDALQPGKYRRPDNGALDIILAAKSDSKRPYFLILDEMNLSHVERYFADFLSAMESGEPVHLHDETDDSWNSVPAKLAGLGEFSAALQKEGSGKRVERLDGPFLWYF